MLYFSARKKLADMYFAWAEKNEVENTPETLIAFLTAYELFDRDKTTEFSASAPPEATIAYLMAYELLDEEKVLDFLEE